MPESIDENVFVTIGMFDRGEGLLYKPACRGEILGPFPKYCDVVIVCQLMVPVIRGICRMAAINCGL